MMPEQQNTNQDRTELQSKEVLDTILSVSLSEWKISDFNYGGTFKYEVVLDDKKYELEMRPSLGGGCEATDLKIWVQYQTLHFETDSELALEIATIGNHLMTERDMIERMVSEVYEDSNLMLSSIEQCDFHSEKLPNNGTNYTLERPCIIDDMPHKEAKMRMEVSSPVHRYPQEPHDRLVTTYDFSVSAIHPQHGEIKAQKTFTDREGKAQKIYFDTLKLLRNHPATPQES